MTKQERREAMPEVTAWIDEIRETFGEINAITASENGQVIEWRNQNVRVLRGQDQESNALLGSITDQARG